MTKREMAAQLLALRTERDELKEALGDAMDLLIRLGANYPHEEGDNCLHCSYLEAAAEVGKPLRRYLPEMLEASAEFARTDPERHAELVRGIFQGGVDLSWGGDTAAGGD